jgi:hypothetical protein
VANTKTPNRKPRTASPSQRLLTGKQVETEYGVPNRSTYDLYLRGLLPAVRFPGGRRLWFERQAIETLIAQSRVTGAW